VAGLPPSAPIRRATLKASQIRQKPPQRPSNRGLFEVSGRLRNLEGSAARPLPPALEISYQPPGFSR
jgi:hypothetical protein